MTFTEHYNAFLNDIATDMYWYENHWYDRAVKIVIYAGLLISKVERKVFGV